MADVGRRQTVMTCVGWTVQRQPALSQSVSAALPAGFPLANINHT